MSYMSIVGYEKIASHFKANLAMVEVRRRQHQTIWKSTLCPFVSFDTIRRYSYGTVEVLLILEGVQYARLTTNQALRLTCEHIAKLQQLTVDMRERRSELRRTIHSTLGDSTIVLL